MRIAVTTSADSTERLVAPLVALGIEPVVLPCIRIEPAPDATLADLRAAAVSADWLFVTSARTVQVTWPDGRLPSGRFAAVGPATAAAISDAGGHVALIGDGGAAELAAALAPLVDGATVVYPAARGADDATAGTLCDAGATVITDAAYVSVPIAPGDDAVDGAVFGSPSAVEGWLRRRTLTELDVVAAMGPTTAAVLIANGRIPEIVPSPPRLDDIVAALASLVPDRSPR